MTTPERPPADDFLRLSDRSVGEILVLLDVATQLRSGNASESRNGRSVAFIWDGEGFRNRAAFELGLQQLGGHGVEIPGRLGEREPVDDLAGYLDNWFDAIVVRTADFDLLCSLAVSAAAPVINARTKHNHPCEILGDLAFIRSTRRHLDGLRLVFVGAATNLCHSWCEAASVLPIQVTQVAPEGFEVDESWWRALGRPAGNLVVSHDLEPHLGDADVLYTDCWPMPDRGMDSEEIERAFSPLCVTGRVLERTPPGAVFLPCPPVTRGHEVSEDAIFSTRCRVFEAKEWLLHAQKALLLEALPT